MKKIIALLLVLCLLFINVFTMVACAPVLPDSDPGLIEPDDDVEPDEDKEPDGDKEPGDNDNSDIEEDNSPQEIISPEFKTDGRLTKKLSEIDYVDVDTDKLYTDFDRVVGLIDACEVGFEEQLEAILSLEEGYVSFKTMYTLSEIYYYKNLGDATWRERYNFYSKEKAKFSQAIEGLYIAAARSPYVEEFEAEYFGDGLYEKYLDGGKYTDEVVGLLLIEEDTKNLYYAISEETVEITFGGVTDNYASIIKDLNAKLYRGEISQSIYYQYYTSCYTEYIKARRKLETDIYVRLVNTRKHIAHALGYASYLEVAYEDMGYDYTPEEYLKFVDEVVESIIPVYDELSVGMANSSALAPLNRVKLINTMYDVLFDIDERFADIYGYMLENELYDIGAATSSRFTGSFTAYLAGNYSPFLFVTTEGTVKDYSTLAHEFGHFIDGYVSYGGTPSLELAEVCSQGLEYIVLSRLGTRLGDATYKTLKQSMIISALETIIYQSMYALFEHYVYDPTLDSVNASILDELAKDAVENVLGKCDSITINYSAVSCSSMLVTHLVIAPLYVQSYSTSIIPSLEIFLDDIVEEGVGLEKYLAIIYREEDYSFKEALKLAGLSSPFDRGVLADIADGLYYNLVGRHFITDSTGGSSAA